MNIINTSTIKSISFQKWFVYLGILLLLGGYAFDEDRSLSTTNNFDAYTEPIPGSDESIKMAPVPGGTFTMGTPEDEQGRESDEGPQHKVKVDDFWMGVHEITWAQYDLFVKEEMTELQNQLASSGEVSLQADAVSLPTPSYIDMSFGMGREGYPAINMTHYAAVMYAKWLSAKTGHFYRLPTEAEWEYACRAGSETAYSFGDDPEELDEFAWYKQNSNEKYHQVASKQPNSLGLHDMHGNVAEWTMDQYLEDYYTQLGDGVAENPVFLPDELYPRSLRGGAWTHEATELRCGNRLKSIERWKRRDPQLPKSRWWHTDAPFVGFRLVRPREAPSKERMEQYWIDAIEDYS